MIGQTDKADVKMLGDLHARKMVCHGLSAHLWLRRARSEQNRQESQGQYLCVRNCVRAFRDVLGQLEKCSIDDKGEARENIAQLHRKQVHADFEATLRLGGWDDVAKIVDEAASLPAKCEDEERDSRAVTEFAGLANMVLASEAPKAGPSNANSLVNAMSS